VFGFRCAVEVEVEVGVHEIHEKHESRSGGRAEMGVRCSVFGVRFSVCGGGGGGSPRKTRKARKKTGGRSEVLG